jgi:hypothetical protein
MLFGISGGIGAAAAVAVSKEEGARGRNPSLGKRGITVVDVENVSLAHRWPVVGANPQAMGWLQMQANLGLAPRTIEAYARGLTD